MASINSTNIDFVLDSQAELGEYGKARTEVLVYKGDTPLTPVSTVPSDGQFRVTINSVDGCTANIKDDNIVYIETLTKDMGVVKLDILLPNGTIINKNFTVYKSTAPEVIKGLETQIETTVNETSEIKQEINSITLQVQAVTDITTTLGNEVTDHEQRIQTAEEKITPDAIKLTVSDAYYNKDQVDEKVSSLTMTSDSIIGEVSDLRDVVKFGGNMIANSRVAFDLTGFESLGGSIVRYEYPVVESFTTYTIDSSEIPSAPTAPTYTDAPTYGNVEGDDYTVTESKPITATPLADTKVRIHFILTPSCGDCILIQCANGKNILIDAPDNTLISSSYPDNTQCIKNYLRKVGVKYLSYVICTHFHSDHAGALPSVMGNFCNQYSTFVYRDFDSVSLATNANEVAWKTQTYRDNCIAKANTMGMKLMTPAQGAVITIDNDTSIKISYGSTIDYANYNSASLILLFTYKNRKVLLLGDAPKTVQDNIYQNWGTVDIVKDAHHGYNELISTGMIKATVAKDVIVTRNHGFGTGSARAYNSVGMWQSYEKNIYSLHYTGDHILIDFIDDYYTISTSKRFYFENCWLKFNGDNTKWCYFKSGGAYARSESIVLEGKTYDFDASGWCTNPYSPR